MGDYPASDLRRPNGMYPHHAERPCAGCGKVPEDADGCYADFDFIWHSTCWPKVNHPETIFGELSPGGGGET